MVPIEIYLPVLSIDESDVALSLSPPTHHLRVHLKVFGQVGMLEIVVGVALAVCMAGFLLLCAKKAKPQTAINTNYIDDLPVASCKQRFICALITLFLCHSNSRCCCCCRPYTSSSLVFDDQSILMNSLADVSELEFDRKKLSLTEEIGTGRFGPVLTGVLHHPVTIGLIYCCTLCGIE